MAECPPQWTEEELPTVAKKELVEYLQKHGSTAFLHTHHLRGKVANVAKATTREKLDEAYRELFVTKEFRTAHDDEEEADLEAKKEAARLARLAEHEAKEKEKRVESPPPVHAEKKHFRRDVLKKGDKRTFPEKGDTVEVMYTGTLEDGTVFDTNEQGKKPTALKFRVGTGRVIRGWDEALQEMSVGERARITVEPEWAYGKKGLEGKIPPHSRLIFEMELLSATK